MKCISSKAFCRIGWPSIRYYFSYQTQPNPLRIEFQQENQFFLDIVLKKHLSKQQLQSQYQLLKFKSDDQSKHSFKSFSQEVSDLYPFIKTEILAEPEFQESSQFIQRAHYYFQKEGKLIRPTMIFMLARLLEKGNQNREKIRKWAALIEMMHIASLAHDDIIDDSPSRRGQQSQHLKYGKKTAVFSGNYIISKASKTIHDFNSPKLFQIYSIAMDNLATGEIIQALTKNKVQSSESEVESIMKIYMNKTYFKTAALMANSLRAVPFILAGEEPSKELAAFRVGQHFGIAFQIVDDILDYTSTAEEMGKQELADIIQGNLTAPVYFTLSEQNYRNKTPCESIIKDLKRKNKNKLQAQKVQQWINSSVGIEKSFLLAQHHLQRGLQFLKELSSEDLGVWTFLAEQILKRRK